MATREDGGTGGRGDAEMFVVDLVADVVVDFVLDLRLAIVPRFSPRVSSSPRLPFLVSPRPRVSASFILPDRASTPARRQSCRGSQS